MTYVDIVVTPDDSEAKVFDVFSNETAAYAAVEHLKAHSTRAYIVETLVKETYS